MPEFFLPDPEIDDGHVVDGKLPLTFCGEGRSTEGLKFSFCALIVCDDGVREMVTGLPGMCVLSTRVSTSGCCLASNLERDANRVALEMD